MGNPDSQDWVRLEVLILRRACTLLRKLFRRRWKITQSTDWLDSPTSGQQFVSTLGSQVYQSCGRLHKMTLEEGDVNNWDFTMLTRILQQVDFKPDGPLKLEFENENQRIEELISYRKKAMEYPKKTISDYEFSNYWDQIEKILVSFGESEKELDDLKRSVSISEEDLFSLSGNETHPVDQLSISEARRLKEEAKFIINSGGNIENVLNCLTSAIGLHNLSDFELGALHASRSDAYLKKAGTLEARSEKRKEVAYLALKDAKQALSLRPAWGLAYYRVGMTYVELNKLKKASKYLDQALDLEPNMEEIKVANNNCKVKLVEVEDSFGADLETFQRHQQKKTKYYPGGTRLSPEVMDRVDIIFFSEDDNILKDIYTAHKLRDGINTKQSYKEAALLYRKGVKSRNAEGMYNLALLKLEGKGVKQDVKGALTLLKKAAKLPYKLCNGNGSNFVSNVGVAESEFVLGLLAAEGIGSPPQKDLFSAAVYYQEASDHGHGQASHNLAILYAKGQGIQKNEKRALQLWKLGASRKISEAMHAIAIHHAKEWDTYEARRWMELAINENENNYEDEDDVSIIWTPQEIHEFEKNLGLIDHWRSKYGQRDISRFEIQSGLSPMRIMNQNLHMKYRLVRMLHGLEAEKEKITEIEEYFNHLQPKPVIIPFPNAKHYSNLAKKEIMNMSLQSQDTDDVFEHSDGISSIGTSSSSGRSTALSVEIEA